MKLIREDIEEVKVILEEDASSGKKSYFIEGVLCQAEKLNKNGRVYPIKTLKNEIDRYNTEYVSKNRAFGELGHPSNPSINLDRVSHIITKMYQDGNNFIGRAKIVDTPMGNIVKGLLDGGATLGVSSRGVGTLRPYNGYQLVQDDFKLATAADIVADPSAPDAFVKGIMEGVDWFFDGNEWKAAEISENVKKNMKTLSKRQVEETALKIFEGYISKIAKL
jgi:hypothetical protein